MRQMFSGLVAAVAVMAASAVPAMACGGGLFQSSCSPCGQAYVSPCAQPEVYAAPVATYSYSGCGSCGGWAHERLPDPVQQYYYANQGPTYTGPGNWAPAPSYQEDTVSGWEGYRHRPQRYGYEGGRYADTGAEGPAYYGYRPHPRFRSWREPTGYYHAPRRGYRYGYAPHRSYAPQYSLPQREFYAPRRSMRYGAPMYAPRHYGYRGYPLRRYY